MVDPGYGKAPNMQMSYENDGFLCLGLMVRFIEWSHPPYENHANKKEKK